MRESAWQREPARQPSPWFSVLAGPLVGSLHLGIGYFFVAQACASGFPWFSLGTLSGLQALILLITIISEAVLIAAWLSGYRRWRQPVGREEAVAPQTPERLRFMAFSGVLLSSVFMLWVLLAGLPVFLLDACHF